MSTTLLADNRHFSCIDRSTHSPVSIFTAADACIRVIQVAHEVAFVLLRTDDSLLGAHLTCIQHLLVPSMLRGTVVEHSILVAEKAWLRRRIQCCLVVILGMQEECFETKGLTFESSVLNVIIGRSVIHELFYRRFRFVTIQDGLDGAASFAGTHLCRLRHLLVIVLFLRCWLWHELVLG